MLQQTRVDTVIPYFARWMERFPTWSALADAPEEEVLSHWQGLGYYQRARRLHGLARHLRATGAAELPSDAQALQALPGLGPYTAGAIASIAFNQPAPIVDGNVTRVFCRILDVEDLPSRPPIREHLWTWASLWAAHERPGDANQALMELGALVCTPRNPACAQCPAAMACLARERNTQSLRPVRPPRKTTPLESTLSWWLVRPDGSYALGVRPAKGRFGGLAELPATEAPAPSASIWDARLHEAEVVGEAEHLLTHRRLHTQVLRLPWAADEPVPPLAAYAEIRWVAPGEALPPLSTWARRVLAAAGLAERRRPTA